ncbi:MAG: hypothetical protein H7Y42_08965 [Chitinophagaceae bacterium]|nr:hypothetical protein [Chitinophagaceae bacterium]
MQHHAYYEYPCSRHPLIAYPFRVWVFAVLVSPILTISWSIVTKTENANFNLPAIQQYLILFFGQSVFCIPAALVYMATFWLLISTKVNVLAIKFVLPLVSIGCLYVITLLFSENFLASLVNIHFLLFSIVLVFLSLALRLREK